MPAYKTPDVYVEEISIFPPSVAEVGTAIPAFIGYTEKAQRVKADDLLLVPTKIYSLKEYEALYGMPQAADIDVALTSSATGYSLTGVTPPTPKYLLYYAVKMYFDNGGSQCYICSVDKYSEDDISLTGDGDSAGLQDGLNAIALQDEPTLLVIPEAIKLSDVNYATLSQAMLTQCGKLQDRFAVIDLFNGDKGHNTTPVLDLATERGRYGTSNLKYGAVYYPFLKTALNHYVNVGETNVKVTIGADPEVTLASLKESKTAAYNLAKSAISDYYVTLPPSSSVVGVYAATDANRGVWKAPANVSLNQVIEPVVRLDNQLQENFNVDTDGGKSVNAIRAFAGKGTLVWGARTLAGNDNEWRYVSVRRFFNMVEESIKKSTHWAVFENNDANTWIKVRGMIENYLIDKWREGALAGATPKEAFFVRCGLGTTMNAQDILEGRMNVEIGMAVVRPAEFIILKFSHMLQTS